MSPLISEEIIREHRSIRAQLGRLMRCGDSRKIDREAQRLHRLIRLHAEAEHLALYPQIQSLGDFYEIAQTLYDEDDQIEVILGQLEEALSFEEQREHIFELQKILEGHMRREETEVLPLLPRYFLQDELMMMGDEYRNHHHSIEGPENLRLTFRNFRIQFKKGFDRFFKRA